MATRDPIPTIQTGTTGSYTVSGGPTGSGDWISASTASIYPAPLEIRPAGDLPIRPYLETPESIIEIMEKHLGIVRNPITKCQHCGQYGAVFCACPKCGAPIDPP